MAFISSQHLEELRFELLKRIELSEGRIEEIDTAVGEVRQKVAQLGGSESVNTKRDSAASDGAE